MKIIPAIDLKDGQCVRLFQGDFEKTTVYSREPAEVARRFSALDVDDLHIVDLDGAQSGRQANRESVSYIAARTGLCVQVGGGIRDRTDVAAWLEAGVARCVLGSTAIKHPAQVATWLEEFGVDAFVLALDVRIDHKGTPMLTTDGWTKPSTLSLWECLDAYGKFDNCHVLCTDVERDGAMTGPNLGLYAELLDRFPNLRLQASGGVRSTQDLIDLRELGVPAAISGRALLDGAISESEVALFRRNA